ncbi:ABC transporter ATP-binding protein [Arthrobacter sp. MYb211]|nr:ABC transporter ATP-binding protein [Arthrobacter sp. MYb221]PRC09126.1 ABC transporter ATP-binding protein [Arthrobacter sp. MYb211]
MAQRVNRSSKSGKFVSKAAAARWPAKTTTERVGSGTKNENTVARSSSTGRFVPKVELKTNPSGTIAQKV